MLNSYFYYADMSVLPKNRQLVFSIRKYIRDTSKIFSMSSLVKISLTSFLCFSSIFLLFSKHSYLCNKKKVTCCFEHMKFIFFSLENKRHMFAPPCLILYISFQIVFQNTSQHVILHSLGNTLSKTVFFL